MRRIACILVLTAAACGGGAEQNKTATKATGLTPGLYELSSRVTAFNKADQGATPQINTPVGTRATEQVCVSGTRPPAALYSGADYDCRYDNYYARNGRVNVTMMCRHDDLSGNIAMTSDGRFEADSLEYDRDIRTSLSGEGDVNITLSVTGRRTGECPPEPADGNETAGNSG